MWIDSQTIIHCNVCTQVFIHKLVQSLSALLASHADAFARHVWSFIHSGLTVAAYDEAVVQALCQSSTQQPIDPGDDGQT